MRELFTAYKRGNVIHVGWGLIAVVVLTCIAISAYAQQPSTTIDVGDGLYITPPTRGQPGSTTTDVGGGVYITVPTQPTYPTHAPPPTFTPAPFPNVRR